ncbi:Pep deformylase, Ribonuclease 3 and/or dsrm domain containing protein, partial [Asbolus verrucosus]
QVAVNAACSVCDNEKGRIHYKMSDSYYYNPNYSAYSLVPNYNASYAPPGPQQWNQWGQWSQSYPPMMAYPPPVNFNVPPPPVGHYNPSYSYAPYPAQEDRESNYSGSRDARRGAPNDYRQELESYKQSKAYQKRDRYRSRDGRKLSRSRSSRSSSKMKKEAIKLEKPTKERDLILSKWRKNYCSTREEVSNKIQELSKLDQEAVLEQEKKIWTRSTPADLFYMKDESNPKVTKATAKLKQICDHFEETLVMRAKKVNNTKPKYVPPPRKNRARLCKHKSEESSSSGSSEEELTDEEDCTMEELQRKQQHPDRLHPEMWYNDPGEMNDGPLCRCSIKSRKSGIRHGIYPGEKHLQKCISDSNNADKLYHYRITISPPTNFLIKTPTIIHHDEHEFIFEGFSMLSHFALVKLPTCKVIRFNIEYTILYIEEKIPDNFTVRELDLFHDYLFKELLELVDLDFKAAGDATGCSQFHFMPRFVRELPDNGKEILSMKEVLQYLLDSSVPLIEKRDLEDMIKMSQYEWQSYADEIKGMVVTYPGQKPCSVRVDQLDRNIDLQKPGDWKFPEIVHFGIRPPQLSYAGNPDYQKAWRDYVKFRHLLANMSKPKYEDKRKLETKENRLQEMRTQGKMKRDITVAVSAEGFYRTGIMCDIIQHAMLIPVLVCHLRFHHSLNILEEFVNYKFKNRALLQLALTHPSYRENFGTNPDHARNSLTNCGIRQPEYGDRRIHYMNTRKRGINTLINIMSRFGKQHETESNITHNERLEFLGDAVVEFLSSIHLFYTFPDLEEGGLATYRAAIVQNQHLAVLAKTLKLDQFMLYAHGSDLCHDLELRHAMANCFEALMGALFLDGGIDVVDRVFSETLFKVHPDLLQVWMNLPPHPLQEQEPTGDRQWIPKFELLQNLTKFEESVGLEFNHIRLLARAFTDRSVGYTNLTLGSNQRLEFLGDTVLQLIASEYLYKYFPEHHEGHLSLLRSSLVNNRTQAVVCDDLGMSNYAVYNNPKAELKTKDRADLLEAFIGALYVDQGLEFCEVFCQVTLFPRLQDFIMNQDWNDPKSKLQQCCLTLRTMDGGEPDIPVYKVIECKGPTNTRVYTVAVYFRGRRLASAMGHSIQQAEMNAAKKALEISQDLFPQLDHQKRVIAKSMKKQKNKKHRSRSRSKVPFCLASKSPESVSYKKLISWYSGLVNPKPQEAPFSHIVQIGDPTLRAVSDEVPPHLIKSPEVKFLISRMKNVMKRYNCVGLSAPQIGIPVRLALIEFNKKHIDCFSAQEQKVKEMKVVPLTVIFNPEIKVTDYTKLTFPENCESIKGFHAEVPRYRGVELRGKGEESEDIEMQAVGWLARIIQHEMDHLDGKLYTDIMDRKSLACSCWQAINDRGGKIELPYGAQ